VTPAQRAREVAIAQGLAMDMIILTALVVVGALGGSLTIIAESIRGALMNACEGLALVVMRRVHRGKLSGLDYGSGKLEQAANLVIGGGLTAGSVWILVGVIELLTGAAPLGAPLGLALAAIVGGINCYINFLAWDGVRRAARGSVSLIMEGQLRARSVKLASSLMVQTTMTIAALSTDHLVVAIADAAGSLLVCVVMGNSAVRMIAGAVPDLIDRAAAPGVRATVERAVTEQLGALAPLTRLRSRRSGGTVFVELTLACAPALSLPELERRLAALRHSLRAELPQADIAILVGDPAA
jgi:divalent metal cation (Fe/Co/Zn/Cd) transporter